MKNLKTKIFFGLCSKDGLFWALLISVVLLSDCIVYAQSPLISVDDTPENLRLPDYYVSNRVQLHTRLSIFQWGQDPLFTDAEDYFAAMGVKVYTRWIRGRGEGAWWPSAVGEIESRANGQDVARQMIDRAHANDMRVIQYNRHIEDNYASVNYPQWLCRDRYGNTVTSGRGVYLCMNSPYIDYYIIRMLELVDRGADGFYFDEVHMPKLGCWCDNCKTRFTAETGLTPPDNNSYSDSTYLRYLQFKNETIERGFERYIAAAHAQALGLPMLISITYAAWLHDPKLRSHLMRIAPSPKWEFEAPVRAGVVSTIFLDSLTDIPLNKWDVQFGFVYTYIRDSAQGRPGHFWTYNLKSAREALAASAVLLTYGHIANLDIDEASIPQSVMYVPALELSKKISPYLARTRPVRWAAIHFSERMRDAYLGDLEQMHRKVLVPCWQSFETLNRLGAPIGTVTDEQIAENELDGYKVLITPVGFVSTTGELENLIAFEANGGIIITLNNDPRWYTAGQQEQIRDELLNEILAKAGQPPISLTGVKEGVHAVAVKKPQDPDRVIVCITNEFTWPSTVQENRLDIEYINDGAETPPPPADDATVFVRGPMPRKVFDAVSGRQLRAFSFSDGVKIAVPSFDYLACIVLDYGKYDNSDFAEFSGSWLQDSGYVDSKMVGWWKFDDACGLTALDSSINHYTGKLINMLDNNWVDGIDAGALSFSGTQRVELSNAGEFDFNGGLTWSLWVKTNAASGQVIMSKSPATLVGTQGDKRLSMTASGTLQLLATGIGGAVPSTGKINDGNWHHIAMTIDFETSGENDTIKLYIDGSRDGGSENARNINQFSDSGFVVMAGNGAGAGFKGSIDDVRIFSRSLTETQVLKLFANSRLEDLAMDINYDCIVDLKDFALMAGKYLDVE